MEFEAAIDRSKKVRAVQTGGAMATTTEVTSHQATESEAARWLVPQLALPRQQVQELLEVWRPGIERLRPEQWAEPPKPPRPALIPHADDRLFHDILIETTGIERRRRGVSAVLSLFFQCLILGVVILIPLWFTDALPKQQLLTFLVAPPPPPPPPIAAAAPRVVQRVTSEITNGSLRSPVRIPSKVQIIREEEAPPISGGVIGGVPGGIPGGQLGGVIGGILSSTANTSAVPKFAPATPQRIRISQGVTKGQLIEKTEAKYPPLALQTRTQGVVVLKAIIAKTGEIQNLELVSGHPMLVPAAIEAVKKWRYRPFLLNGVPVEVETQVTVTFQISG